MMHMTEQQIIESCGNNNHKNNCNCNLFIPVMAKTYFYIMNLKKVLTIS